jgi:hypothetical protein
VVLAAQVALVRLHNLALVVDTAQVVLHPVQKLDLLLVLELVFITAKLALIVVYFAVEQYLPVAALVVLAAVEVRVRDILNLNLMERLDRLEHRAALMLVLVVLAVLAGMVVFLARVEMLEQQVQQALMEM